MATRTTWPVEEGKVTSLIDFAHLYFRDREGDVPPKVLEVSDRFDRQVAEAHTELERLRDMTPEEIQAACAEFNARIHRSWEESAAGVKAKNDRYRAMIAKVEAWDAPEILAKLKENMLRDLRESMSTERDAPEPMLPDEWVALHLDMAYRTIEVARQNKASEEAEVTQRNAWVAAFFNEFPGNP